VYFRQNQLINVVQIYFPGHIKRLIPRATNIVYLLYASVYRINIMFIFDTSKINGSSVDEE